MSQLSPVRTGLLLAALLTTSATVATNAVAASAPLRGIDTAATWVSGDVNGDGRPDLQGRPSGLGITFATATSDVRTAPSGPGLDLKAATGETLGEISDSGDFDGDGFDDLLVTAERGSTALVYVVHGAAAGGTVTVTAGPRVTAIGLAVPYQFGVAPRFIGDFSGDGKDDIGVGRQTGTNVSATNWSGGFAIVLGAPATATAINANAASARVLLINATRSCGFIFLSWVCGTSAVEVDPVGDVSGDGRADLFVDGASASRRYTLLGRAATGTYSTTTLPPNALRLPAFFALGRAFATPAGDVNADGVGDYSVVAKVSDATATPQRRLIILGTRATSGTAQAGPSLVSSGEVGAAELVHDLTGDGRPDLIVLTKTRDTSGFDDFDPASWNEELYRVHARIASIPAAATETIDLDAAPSLDGLPEAGYTGTSGSLYRLRVADVEGDTRPELAIPLAGRLLLASTTGVDRLAPQLFDDPNMARQGVTLPNAAINPADGAPRGLRMREAGILNLDYRRADGASAGSEDLTLPAGTTLDQWRGTVAGVTLPAGTYTLRATPRDGFGNRGQTQSRQVVISGGSTAATIDVESRFTNPDGSLITPGGASYRFDCANGEGSNGTWVGGDNGQPIRVDTSDMPTPPVAGAACELRFNFFAGDLAPSACGTQPHTATVNGQRVEVSTSTTIAFTVQPGANHIVHERGCTAPVFDGAQPVPGLASPEWVGSGSAKGGAAGSVILTSGANQTGGKVFPFPVDPNRRTYEFKVTMAGGNGQGEGVALAFVKPKDGAVSGGFPGTGGGALGLGGLQGTFIAIDQRQGAGDTAANAIGIADGASATGLNWLQTANPGQRIRARGAVPIKVVAGGGSVSVYVNGTLRLTRTMTLPSPAFVAISGSTGTIWQNQTISEFKVTP